MKILKSPAAASRAAAAARRPLVLVPTMGALHAGHLELIDRARRAAGVGGTVAASIFVNPIQFGPGEDLAKYPRPFARDRKLCAEHGVDLLFHPAPEAVYPAGFSTHVEETSLSGTLCGASRPGHFRGVCTVVLKLFHIFTPEIAFFGQKDYQQLAVIRRMVRDLDVPVRIRAVPAVREPDGLALSSRNRYLTQQQRQQAPALYQALKACRQRVRQGVRSAARLKQEAAAFIRQETGGRIDYIEVVDADTLEARDRVDGAAVMALAVFFGKTRLIDNIRLR